MGEGVPVKRGSQRTSVTPSLPTAALAVHHTLSPSIPSLGSGTHSPPCWLLLVFFAVCSLSSFSKRQRLRAQSPSLATLISQVLSSGSPGFKCHLHVDRFPIYIFSSDVFLELKNRKMNLPVDFTFPKIKYREMSVAGRLKILTLSLLGSNALTTREHPTLTQHLVIVVIMGQTLFQPPLVIQLM